MESVPVLKIEEMLLVSIQVDMDDNTALALQDELTNRIVETGATGVVIDITALDIVDSFIGRLLSTIASVSRVLDAETVVVGMRPAVAITLVELGLSLDGVRTALDVERGMALLRRHAPARAAALADGYADDGGYRNADGYRTTGGGYLDTGGGSSTPAAGDAVTADPRTAPLATWPIRRDDDVVRVRQAVRTVAVSVRLSLVDQTKLVTAASELARNTLIHGGGGQAVIEQVASDRRRGVRVVFADTGPGIPDLDLAFTDGYTSGGGLGLGLSGARRLVDEFDIETEIGAGTRITVVKWAR